MVQRVYELTTNYRDGFAKWYVIGIKSDVEARRVALKGFGKKFYSDKLIAYYSDFPSEYGTDWSKALTISQFIKKANKIYGVK